MLSYKRYCTSEEPGQPQELLVPALFVLLLITNTQTPAIMFLILHTLPLLTATKPIFRDE